MLTQRKDNYLGGEREMEQLSEVYELSREQAVEKYKKIQNLYRGRVSKMRIYNDKHFTVSTLIQLFIC